MEKYFNIFKSFSFFKKRNLEKKLRNWDYDPYIKIIYF